MIYCNIIRISVPCGLAPRRISKAFHTGVSNFRGRCHSHKSQCLLQGCFQLLKNKISAHCIKKRSQRTPGLSLWDSQHSASTGSPSRSNQPMRISSIKNINTVSLLNICRPFLCNFSLTIQHNYLHRLCTALGTVSTLEVI